MCRFPLKLPVVGCALIGLIVVPLNARHQPLGYHVCHIGTTNSCPVSMKEVFLPCVISGATAAICAHNHPSGDCNPSPEDERITDRLRDAGELLSIQLLDHLIITRTHYYSVADRTTRPLGGESCT